MSKLMWIDVADCSQEDIFEVVQRELIMTAYAYTDDTETQLEQSGLVMRTLLGQESLYVTSKLAHLTQPALHGGSP